jgi:ketosteroid isomerase-like protein
LVLVLLGSTPVLGADIDDFKAAFNKAVKDYNNRDDAFFASMHAQAAVFNPGMPFAIDGKAAYEKAMRRSWAMYESSVFTPVNPQFRVIGSTGVGWGHYALAMKPKDGGMETRFGRYTVVSVKSGGKWHVVASHYSPIPSGN